MALTTAAEDIIARFQHRTLVFRPTNPPKNGLHQQLPWTHEGHHRRPKLHDKRAATTIAHKRSSKPPKNSAGLGQLQSPGFDQGAIRPPTNKRFSHRENITLCGIPNTQLLLNPSSKATIPRQIRQIRVATEKNRQHHSYGFHVDSFLQGNDVQSICQP